MTFAQQRAAAEERANALLRSIVPADEWRYQVRRSALGRIVERVPTHIEFVGQSGKYTYRIYLHQTSENIERESDRGYTSRLCGGPYAYMDYCTAESTLGGRIPQVDHLRYEAGRREAGMHAMPAHLPNSDIHLGQYLALKYDEKRFLQAANVF